MAKTGDSQDFILVVGSCNADLTCHVERLPVLDMEQIIHGNSFDRKLGGKAVNQAVAVSKLGAPVCLAAMKVIENAEDNSAKRSPHQLGKDHYGEAFLKLFKEVNISTEGIEIVTSTHTGLAQITVDENGDKQTVIIPGANKLMTSSHISSDGISNLLSKAEVGLFQFEIGAESTKTAMTLMKANGKGTVILNCAPAITGVREIHSLADILILNETQVLGTIGVPILSYIDMQPIMQKFFDLDCNTVIITLGKTGAVFASKEQPTTVFVPVPDQAIETPFDPEGASDAFCGALAFTFLKFKEMPLLKRIEFACFVASNTVSRLGKYESFPSLDVTSQFF